MTAVASSVESAAASSSSGAIATPTPLGFTLAPSAVSSRMLNLRVDAAVVTAFLEATEHWPVQALEYKSMLRFRVAAILDELCANTLRPHLVATLLDRAHGAMQVVPEGLDRVEQADAMVKFATAVAHLVGRSNFDAMSGQYYARFVVENVDASDSYLRQPHRVMELHNDGTFVEQVTDYVLMMKLDERNMVGGDSRLLHLDDWEDLERFSHHPLAFAEMRWSAPASKKVTADVYHPVFDVDRNGRPVMSYIDQFVQPGDLEQGQWLCQLSDSLEGSEGVLSVPNPVGSFLLLNNHFWLHGRDRFASHPKLRRELMRQRGVFTGGATLRR
ncbi:glutarate dioxygenase GlaH [Halomonas sp. V046]|uniref:glutarate dioxygenase GlaH n=1 Tax=Halomonas sp. V046 TaxID=3459611 RepID=UPI0040441FD5